MKTEHTPGPWHLSMKPGPMIYGPQGEQIANMHIAMLERDEHIKNARLIAAAPELLNALELAEATLRGTRSVWRKAFQCRVNRYCHT